MLHTHDTYHMNKYIQTCLQQLPGFSSSSVILIHIHVLNTPLTPSTQTQPSQPTNPTNSPCFMESFPTAISLLSSMNSIPTTQEQAF